LGLDEDQDEWDVDDEDENLPSASDWTVSHKVPEVNCSVVYNVQETVEVNFFLKVICPLAAYLP
jgi:hypothetical protein